MVKNLDELVTLIMRRDGISRLEAENIVDQTWRELFVAIDDSEPLETLEDILSYSLSLEPDYLTVFLENM